MRFCKTAIDRQRLFEMPNPVQVGRASKRD
jgi:hypothetical protein